MRRAYTRNSHTRTAHGYAAADPNRADKGPGW
jgi:hypothetical protein